MHKKKKKGRVVWLKTENLAKVQDLEKNLSKLDLGDLEWFKVGVSE